MSSPEKIQGRGGGGRPREYLRSRDYLKATLWVWKIRRRGKIGYYCLHWPRECVPGQSNLATYFPSEPRAFSFYRRGKIACCHANLSPGRRFGIEWTSLPLSLGVRRVCRWGRAATAVEFTTHCERFLGEESPCYELPAGPGTVAGGRAMVITKWSPVDAFLGRTALAVEIPAHPPSGEGLMFPLDLPLATSSSCCLFSL